MIRAEPTTSGFYPMMRSYFDDGYASSGLARPARGSA